MTVSPKILFRVFPPFAAGYFLSYLFRTVNAVIAPNLINDLGVGPSALGVLTAVYFIAFASFQLPLGVLLDRFGPRRIEAILLLFAALGAALFARAETLAGLIAGRAFIGFGVSACLMAAFKAYTMWIPREKWPLVNGLQMSAGGLGALAATAPVEAALQLADWRGVFLGLTLLTLLIAGSVFIVVPEKAEVKNQESTPDQLLGIREIFTSRIFWRVTPLTVISQATFLSIQGLWAGPWCTHVAGFSRPEVARILFAVALAMVVGYIVLGGVAERLHRRGVAVATTAVIGMTIFMVVQFLLLFNLPSFTMALWVAFGFFGTSGVISYSALSQSFPVRLSGRVTTALNLLVFVAAFCFQWAIGAIIGLWANEDGKAFSPPGFTAAFAMLLVLELAGLIFYNFYHKSEKI